MAVFPLREALARTRAKIKSGEPVSIGVFCSGNGDRSPFAEQVLKNAFAEKGFSNVKVFSFGVSVSPSSHLGPAAAQTTSIANEIGYTGINKHKRRSIVDDDVQSQIKAADLLFGVSPGHVLMAAEYTADEHPQALRSILGKTLTLRGFANKRDWLRYFEGIPILSGAVRRATASADPYFFKQNPAKFKAALMHLRADCLKTVNRLLC